MEQEELQTIYGCLWDKWLPGLYRFALFLTNDPSQAQTYLEQVFLNCWNSGAFRKCLKEKGNTAFRMSRCLHKGNGSISQLQNITVFYQDIWLKIA